MRNALAHQLANEIAAGSVAHRPRWTIMGCCREAVSRDCSLDGIILSMQCSGVGYSGLGYLQ